MRAVQYHVISEEVMTSCHGGRMLGCTWRDTNAWPEPSYTNNNTPAARHYAAASTPPFSSLLPTIIIIVWTTYELRTSIIINQSVIVLKMLSLIIIHHIILFIDPVISMGTYPYQATVWLNKHFRIKASVTLLLTDLYRSFGSKSILLLYILVY